MYVGIHLLSRYVYTYCTVNMDTCKHATATNPIQIYFQQISFYQLKVESESAGVVAKR